MPSLETSERHQTAVLWPSVGYDHYGEPTVGPPEEIKVRWENGYREALDMDGTKIGLDALAVVNVNISPNSLMWLGTLEDWYGVGSAGDDTNLMVVRTFERTPDLKNRAVRRTVGLVRHKNREQ